MEPTTRTAKSPPKRKAPDQQGKLQVNAGKKPAGKKPAAKKTKDKRKQGKNEPTASPARSALTKTAPAASPAPIAPNAQPTMTTAVNPLGEGDTNDRTPSLGEGGSASTPSLGEGGSATTLLTPVVGDEETKMDQSSETATESADEDDWHQAAEGEQDNVTDTHCITFQPFYQNMSQRGPDELYEQMIRILPGLEEHTGGILMNEGRIAHLMTVCDHKDNVLTTLTDKTMELNAALREKGGDNGFQLAAPRLCRSNRCGKSEFGDPWLAENGFMAKHHDANVTGEEEVTDRNERINRMLIKHYGRSGLVYTDVRMSSEGAKGTLTTLAVGVGPEFMRTVNSEVNRNVINSPGGYERGSWQPAVPTPTNPTWTLCRGCSQMHAVEDECEWRDNFSFAEIRGKEGQRIPVAAQVQMDAALKSLNNEDVRLISHSPWHVIMSVAENADPEDAAEQMAGFVQLVNRKSGMLHWTPIELKTINEGCRSCGTVCTAPQQNIREDCEEVKPEHVKARRQERGQRQPSD
jgi:hypothetical protein